MVHCYSNRRAIPSRRCRLILGEAVVAQNWVSNESMRNLPVRLNGLIAVPLTGTNHPLAVIIHGSHGTGCRSTDGINEKWPCPDIETPHYAGFAYLLEALAADGYVAVSINANPAFVMAYGGSSPNNAPAHLVRSLPGKNRRRS